MGLIYIFMTISSQQKLMRMDTVLEISTTNFVLSSIDPEKEGFDIFNTINEILRHMKQSPKKTLIDKISTRLLGLESKSDNTIKWKAMNMLLKKYFLFISNVVWFYFI